MNQRVWVLGAEEPAILNLGAHCGELALNAPVIAARVDDVSPR